MTAVADGIADGPEDPVHNHCRPYAEQSQVEHISEQIGRADPEHPHGKNGDDHRTYHVSCRAEGVGNGKGRHPEQNRHDIVEAHYLDCHLGSLRSQIIQLHQNGHADKKDHGHQRGQRNGYFHHFSGIIPGLFDLPGADADGSHAHQSQVDGGTEQDIPVRQSVCGGICRDRGGSHGGNHAEHQDLAELEHAVLQAVGHRDIKNSLNQNRIEAETDLSAEIDVPGRIEHHHQNHNGAHVTGYGGGNCGPGHAPFQPVDADSISDQVDRIDQKGNPHGDARVIHGAEYGRAGIINGKPREGDRRDDQVGFRRLHNVRFDLSEHQAQQSVMKGDENNGDDQRQAGCKHQNLPGDLAGLFLVLLSQIVSGDHGAACGQRGKNIDEQDIHRIHQGNPGNRGFARRGYHDRIRHADRDRQRLFDDQRNDQFLQISV